MTLRKINFIQTIFIIIVVFFVFILISGTIVGVKERKKRKVVENNIHTFDLDYLLFNEIGMLRLYTSDSNPVLVVINPILSYPKNNIPLQEELIKKKKEFKTEIESLVSSYSASELKSLEEEEIKNMITNLLNSKLTLGEIYQVFFDEFQIFDR